MEEPMRRSTERILTTHTGSLPRPPALLALMGGLDQRGLSARPDFGAEVENAVRDIVQRQAEVGLDVVNDGEMGKVAYSTYVTERLTGFDGPVRPLHPYAEARQFPGFYQAQAAGRVPMALPACDGPIRYVGAELVRRDIANLRAALEGADVAEAFMTAASPGVVWYFLENGYYPSHEAYVFAVADAMRDEYRAIVDAGLVLQLDCPDLAMGWNRAEFADATFDDFRKVVALHVAALNHALEGIPPDRVRLHLCWGNVERPHVRDIPLDRVLDLVLGANAGAFSFEGANPRHEHEWKVFKEIRLPEGKAIIPGVLDSTTNFVEHPELVAERLVRYAEVVGKENVLAGTDCGFSTAAGMHTVHPEVTWAKLRALAEGARLASDQLW
jgi:5-methyltetrahydropteroyltriglutamate--homocysteine methyltransferase